MARAISFKCPHCGRSYFSLAARDRCIKQHGRSAKHAQVVVYFDVKEDVPNLELYVLRKVCMASRDMRWYNVLHKEFSRGGMRFSMFCDNCDECIKDAQQIVVCAAYDYLSAMAVRLQQPMTDVLGNECKNVFEVMEVC